MMDGTEVPESVIKRNNLRQERIAKKKEDKSQQEQSDYFQQVFKDKQRGVEEALESAIGVTDRTRLAALFQSISDDIQLMNKHVFTSSLYLRPYDIRICKDVIQGLQEAASTLEHKLMPKKKFGFTSKATTNEVKSPPATEETEEAKKYSTEEDICGFKDRSHQELTLSGEETCGRDVVLSNLRNCTVLVLGTPNTVNMNGIYGCRVVCRPVRTSVMVDECSGCDLAVAAQQLRVHKTTRTNLYVHTTTGPVIEDTTGVLFAPYNYSCTEEDMRQAGLDPSRNMWAAVEDFNWLAPNKHSPNWGVLPEHDRRTSWTQQPQ